MGSNEKFMAKWKPIHDKTMIRYVILESLFYLFILIIFYIFLNFIKKVSNFEAGIGLIIISYSIFLIDRIITWIKGEKRYHDIKNNKL